MRGNLLFKLIDRYAGIALIPVVIFTVLLYVARHT